MSRTRSPPLVTSSLPHSRMGWARNTSRRIMRSATRRPRQNSMRIAYLANIRLPTEKAHGLQIMKTCEAFVKAGHEVELIVTDRKTPITEEPFAYYGVKTKFTITRLSVPDTVHWGKVGFWWEMFNFART